MSRRSKRHVTRSSDVRGWMVRPIPRRFGLLPLIPPTRVSEPGGLSPWYQARNVSEVEPARDADERCARMNGQKQFHVGLTLHPDTTNIKLVARWLIPLVSGTSVAVIDRRLYSGSGLPFVLGGQPDEDQAQRVNEGHRPHRLWRSSRRNVSPGPPARLPRRRLVPGRS